MSADDANASMSWRAPADTIAQLERQGAAWNFREECVPPYTLPAPLLGPDGKRVRTAQEWERDTRPQTLELFARLVYGRAPAAPGNLRFEVLDKDPAALGGRAIRRAVRIHIPTPGGDFPIDTTLMIPRRRARPAPLFLLINNTPKPLPDDARRGEPSGFWPFDELIGRDYATAVFQTRAVQPDDDMTSHARGLIAAMDVPEVRQWRTAGEAWGNLSAWAWTASRVMDYLQTAADVDATRVAVLGHSRGGKTALWAAAQDPRFALTIAGESGLMGATLSRRIFGETFAGMTKARPYWFCGNYQAWAGREQAFPVDQHQLLALIAPRPLYIASADEDLWADPRGEYLALAHAGPVYRLYGLATPEPGPMPPLDRQVVRGNTGYHIRRGKHDLTVEDWRFYMDFADHLWR